jgi:hypothetical protein
MVLSFPSFWYQNFRVSLRMFSFQFARHTRNVLWLGLIQILNVNFYVSKNCSVPQHMCVLLYKIALPTCYASFPHHGSKVLQSTHYCSMASGVSSKTLTIGVMYSLDKDDSKSPKHRCHVPKPSSLPSMCGLLYKLAQRIGYVVPPRNKPEVSKGSPTKAMGGAGSLKDHHNFECSLDQADLKRLIPLPIF